MFSIGSTPTLVSRHSHLVNSEESQNQFLMRLIQTENPEKLLEFIREDKEEQLFDLVREILSEANWDLLSTVVCKLKILYEQLPPFYFYRMSHLVLENLFNDPFYGLVQYLNTSGNIDWILDLKWTNGNKLIVDLDPLYLNLDVDRQIHWRLRETYLHYYHYLLSKEYFDRALSEKECFLWDQEYLVQIEIFASSHSHFDLLEMINQRRAYLERIQNFSVYANSAFLKGRIKNEQVGNIAQHSLIHVQTTSEGNFVGVGPKEEQEASGFSSVYKRKGDALAKRFAKGIFVHEGSSLLGLGVDEIMLSRLSDIVLSKGHVGRFMSSFSPDQNQIVFFRRILQDIPNFFKSDLVCAQKAWLDVLDWSEKSLENLQILLKNRDCLKTLWENPSFTAYVALGHSENEIHICRKYLALISDYFKQIVREQPEFQEFKCPIDQLDNFKKILSFYKGSLELERFPPLDLEGLPALLDFLDLYKFQFFKDCLEQHIIKGIKRPRIKTLKTYEEIGLTYHLSSLSKFIQEKFKDKT